MGHKEGKPQPGGAPESFTLLEKAIRRAGRKETTGVVCQPGRHPVRSDILKTWRDLASPVLTDFLTDS